MNYSLKMARLDYFTCKPNIISYFTLIPVTIIFSFMSTSSIFIFNFTAAWFIALMSTNIFVVQEKYTLSIVLRQVFEFFSMPGFLFPLQRVGRTS